MTSKIDVYHRTFWKVVPKFYDRCRFPKVSPRLTEAVDMKISKKTMWKGNFQRLLIQIVLTRGKIWKKLVWKCASRNFVTCTIFQLSTFSGIHEENLKDPYTDQKQVVNRITTLVKPMSLWSPVNSSSMNPSAVEATARWQTAHGKLKMRALSCLSTWSLQRF